MQVYSIKNINHNYNPTFSSWVRETKDKTGKIINRNNTCFFRDASFFSKLTKMLSEKFENVPKVNVYCFGCSDGSEPFTFAMSMLTNDYESNPQKFFPIKARDIDPVALAKIRANNYSLTKFEKDAINKYTQGMYNRFIYQPKPDPLIETERIQVFVKSEIYDCVDF